MLYRTYTNHTTLSIRQWYTNKTLTQRAHQQNPVPDVLQTQSADKHTIPQQVHPGKPHNHTLKHSIRMQTHTTNDRHYWATHPQKDTNNRFNKPYPIKRDAQDYLEKDPPTRQRTHTTKQTGCHIETPTQPTTQTTPFLTKEFHSCLSNSQNHLRQHHNHTQKTTNARDHTTHPRTQYRCHTTQHTQHTESRHNTHYIQTQSRDNYGRTPTHTINAPT